MSKTKLLENMDRPVKEYVKEYRVTSEDIVMEHSILVKDGYDAVFCQCGYTLYFPKVKELGVYQIVCPDCGHVAYYYHLRNVKG